MANKIGQLELLRDYEIAKAHFKFYVSVLTANGVELDLTDIWKIVDPVNGQYSGSISVSRQEENHHLVDYSSMPNRSLHVSPTGSSNNGAIAGNFGANLDGGNQTVYFNEENKAIVKSFPKKPCFLCANDECKKKLVPGSVTAHDGEIYCIQCYGRLFGSNGCGYGSGAGTLSMFTGEKNGSEPGTSNIPATAQAHVASKTAPVVATGSGSAVTPKYGSNEVCPRCGEAVYFAEKIMGGGSAWHKTTCFTCKECNKRLESTTLCERECEIYCKTCYDKLNGQ